MAWHRLKLALLFLVCAAGMARADITIDFSDHPLPPNSFDNGSSGSGGFTSNGAFLNNSYDSTFSAWSGWSLSNVNNKTTAGFTNQYAAITGTSPTGSGTYAIANTFSPNDAFINLPTGYSASSFDVTNTTYAYLSMKTGDQFAKKFTTGDFFLLTVTGYSGLGATGTALASIPIYLANYTSDEDNPLNVWRNVGLTSLAGAKSLGFSLTSSDNGQFGMNTPAYFAMDELVLTPTAVPEPSSLALAGIGIAGFAAVRYRRSRLKKKA